MQMLWMTVCETSWIYNHLYSTYNKKGPFCSYLPPVGWGASSVELAETCTGLDITLALSLWGSMKMWANISASNQPGPSGFVGAFCGCWPSGPQALSHITGPPDPYTGFIVTSRLYAHPVCAQYCSAKHPPAFQECNQPKNWEIFCKC